METLNQAWELIGAERALLFWLIPLILTGLALYLLAPAIKRWTHRRRIDKVLARLGPEHLAGVVLEDGVEGLTHIDRLIAGPRGLTVVTLVPHDGIIFGGDDIDRWTRVIGRRTIKFPNPIADNREGVLAVQYHLPGTPVQGLTLFTGECSFPKGKPDTAVLPDEIRLPSHRPEIPSDVQQVWDRLRTLAEQTAKRHSSELRLIKGERSHGRPMIGWALLLMAGVSVGWGLVV